MYNVKWFFCSLESNNVAWLATKSWLVTWLASTRRKKDKANGRKLDDVGVNNDIELTLKKSQLDLEKKNVEEYQVIAEF